MVRLPSRWKFRTWSVFALAAVLTKAGAGITEPHDLEPANHLPLDGAPIAIPVRNGRASFGIPGQRPNSSTLVIVSALSRKQGPFPIRVVAHSSQKAKPITATSEVPANPPRRPAPEPFPVPPPPALGPPPDQRIFHLLVQGGEVTSPSNYLAVDGRLRGVGQRIQVYVDSRDSTAVATSTISDLISTFDEKVFPDAAARFGSAEDVDRDGRFTVLFSSWLTRLAGGKVSVDGFVRGADLDRAVAVPFGNQCDMMYLSTTLKAGPHLRTIVAHEYTHAVTFSRKALVKMGNCCEEEGWLDEALAHLVEDSHGFSQSNIDYRVSAFLSAPERYRLVVDDYYATDLFRSHGNRGATYLFLRWCVDNYGPGLVDSMVRSERRGIENLEQATGTSFSQLFRRWTVSLYLSGLDPARSPEGAYRSIDPRGELEEWILAGPRVSSIRAGSAADSWTAEGTTTHYTIVEAANSEAVAVDVDGPADAEIQVTMVPLPAGMGRPELSVSTQKNPDGELQFRAEVRERNGTRVRLGALAWEPLVPSDDPRAPLFRGSRLDMLGIASKFGTSKLPAHGSLSSGAITLTGASGFKGDVVFKAVGTDEFGRRVAAWSILTPSVNLGPLSRQGLPSF